MSVEMLAALVSNIVPISSVLLNNLIQVDSKQLSMENCKIEMNGCQMQTILVSADNPPLRACQSPKRRICKVLCYGFLSTYYS